MENTMVHRMRWAGLVGLILGSCLTVAGCGVAATPGAPTTGITWVWAGAVTSTSAVVKAKVAPAGEARLLVGVAPGQYDPALSTGAAVTAGDDLARVVAFSPGGLAPATVYHYAVALDGVTDTAHAGTFRTFPAGAADVTIAFASCARTGSNAAVFDRIQADRPDVFIHMGDLHYEDIARDDVARFRAAYDAVLASPAQSGLYRSVPLAYVWDDHDFGANNSTGSSPSRPAAMQAYHEIVPHYPLAGDDAPIYQAFTIGRVRVLLTDTRSARDPAAGTVLGAQQKAWLKSELLAGRDAYPLVVWMNPSPWIAAPDVSARLEGTWGAFPAERAELARFIAAHHIRNLAMVSGDAHMLAIDDGTNNRYADPAGPPGFPVMQAAALDKDGSVKGGPYSEGTFPGRGQYGLMHVSDDGGPAVTVAWEGRNERGERLVTLRFTVPAPGQ
jgi:phosphodiesterase/alkaline phosphatase D-like protein